MSLAAQANASLLKEQVDGRGRRSLPVVCGRERGGSSEGEVSKDVLSEAALLKCTPQAHTSRRGIRGAANRWKVMFAIRNRTKA